MNTRDYDYIEARLYGDSPSIEAAGRLRQCGRTDLSARITKAVQKFNDELRSIRQDFKQSERRGS